MAPLLAAFTASITLLTAVVLMVRELRKQRSAIIEVHQLVNSRLDAALAQVREMTLEIAELKRELVFASAHSRTATRE